MGIHQLMQLIREKAPRCFRELMMDYFQGRTVACDASLAMYQFLIQTQGFSGNQIVELTDKEGNKTGHLVGLFNRTIQFMENGIKPVWVFDGKPPVMKNGELAKRKKKKEEAQIKTEQALEQGDMQQALLQNQRTVTITSQMKNDAINMLKLLGCPVVIAPCEAEAQCAQLCKAGKVYATATEDLDALTFQTPILLRGFNNKKEPIYEIVFQDMLNELKLTYDQFVDLCILCGCDYTEKIDGIGPGTAYKFILEHKNIENILQEIKRLNEEKVNSKQNPRFTIPQNFYYEDSRELFKNPITTNPDEIDVKWSKPDVENLKKFLCEEKGFAETRVDNGLKKLEGKSKSGNQTRLESFFGKPTKIINSDKKKDVKKTTKQVKKTK
ncbi:Elongation of fatty acids protein 2 [Paramecium bursaria]